MKTDLAASLFLSLAISGVWIHFLTPEWLWYNFATPVELHDYRYLGDNFRERERIKRKKTRWTARLARMPALERQALLAAIADSAGSSDVRSPHAGSGDRAPNSL